MIDIQDHIRNRGALNLFDGKGVKPNTYEVATSPFARLTGTIIDPSKPEPGKAKVNTFTERQTINPTEDGKVEHIVFWWDRDRWQYIAQRGPEWRYISEGALCFNPFDRSKFWHAAPLPNGVIQISSVGSD